MGTRDVTLNDRWSTLVVGCKGGLNLNYDTVTLSQTPGAAVSLVNYEPSIFGGYRRINGYTTYSATTVSGTGNILGVKVFQSGVVVARGTAVWYGTGSAWSAVNGTSVRSAGSARYRFVTYNWTGVQRIIMVDGVNPAALWDGTTYTKLNGTNSPASPAYVEEFKNQIFYAGMAGSTSIVQWSKPADETDFVVADGGGAFVVGDVVTGIKKFRDTLYIFTRNKIMKIVGSTSADFVMTPVTANIGCINGDSIQEINGDLIFLSPDGFRPLEATYRIGDVEIANISHPIFSRIAGILPSTYMSSCLIRNKSQYRFFYNTNTSQPDAQGLIAAVVERSGNKQSNDLAAEQYGQSQSWEWAETLGILATCADSGLIGPIELVVHANMDGFVYQQETGVSFNGANITSSYMTPALFLDDPTYRKILQKLDIYYRVEGTFSVSVNIILDFNDSTVLQPTAFSITAGSGLVTYGGSAATYGAGVYGGGNSPISNNNILGSGYVIQINFYSVSATDLPHTIQGYSVQYQLSGRR